MATVQAQRFTGNPTLQACVDGQHRMLAGEPDAVAVRKLQSALSDLGYPVRGGIDGIFAGGTGDAVVAFKTDEDLQPTDPVAARGTIGRLDAYFQHEVTDPDFPDPSADGLEDLTLEAMDLAVSWVDAAVDALRQFPSAEEHPTDPVWAAFDDRLQRNFHVARSSMGRERAIDNAILPLYDQAVRALDSSAPIFAITELDQAGFAAAFPGTDYVTALERVGSRLFITPAFRNALTADERAESMIRFAAGLDGRINLFAVPGSPRFANLPGDQGIANTMAYAAFAFETATGTAAPFHGHSRWSI